MAADLMVLERQPTVEVLTARNPFTHEWQRIVVQEGETISRILARLAVPAWADALVELDGVPVPRSLWPRTRPKAGHRLRVRLVPRGGGGGDDDNKTLRLVLTIIILIIVIVIAYFVPAAWAAVPLIIGSLAIMAVNMLLAPPPPNLGKLAAIAGTARNQESPTLSIAGSRNKANPFGPVPKLFGRHRLFPPLGAANFTEQVGNDQYLRQLFAVGYGPLELTELKIGDTPIENFDGVELEVRQGFPDDPPLTLYSNDIDEAPLNISLTMDGGPQARAASQPADELSVDIVFPQGLVRFLSNGAQVEIAVDFRIEYREVGAVDWVEIPESPVTVTDNRVSQVRRGFRWVPPTPFGTPRAADYEVRLTRLTADANDAFVHDQAVWSALRAIRYQPPIIWPAAAGHEPGGPGLALIALRIKATDQLNGTVDQLNCIATAILPDWDAETETWVVRATRNPASAYREVLQGPGNARPFLDSRLSLSNLQAWHEENTAQALFYDQVIDFRTTVLEQLRIIAGAGRASVTMIDGKHGVVMDLPQSVPVQHFTPRNSWGFKSTKLLPDLVHGWKVHFINPEAGWQQDEVIVYADGFDASNATKFEVLELTGVTNKDQAYRLARYHLAALRLRPELYELNADVENLVCTRGDLVRVTHDVPSWGYGAGRILEVTTVDGLATEIRLDEVFPMVAGGNYVVRIRLADGTSVLQAVVNLEGATKTLIFTTPLAAPLPEVGDLVLFGEFGLESVECIVKMIEHDHDFIAKLTLLDAAPAIHAAATGPVPPFETQISRPPILQQTPPVPVIDDIRSDESVLERDASGALQPRIVLSLRYLANSGLKADWLEVQYRRHDSTSPYIALPQVAPGTPVITVAPVEERVTYDLRLRTVNAALNVTSPWIAASHTVVGKTSPPPVASGLTLEGTLLRWSYPSPPPDFAGFELRQIAGAAPNWEQGLRLHDGLVSATSFTLPVMMGLRTLMVKPVDIAGNLASAPAALTVDFGTAPLRNIVESRDERAAGFPGLKEAATVSGISGDLEADQEPAAFWGPPTARFWTNDAALFWTSPYKPMRYTWTYVTGAQADGTKLLLEVVAQGSYTLEWKRSADAAWQPFAGILEAIAANTSLDLRVSIAGGQPQGILSTLVLFLDAPDLTESLLGVAISAAGTRLPVANTYRAVKTVQLTVNHQGAETAISARTRDKLATGPLVEALDAAGAAVAGHVDAAVVGF